MAIQRTISRLLYHIEAKPEGGFIARCGDPTLPALEGATRTEVERKIQASINTQLTTQFPALKPIFENQEIKFAYHIEAKPDGGFVVNSSDPAHQPMEASSREKIESMIASQFLSYVMGKLPPELSQQVTSQLGSGGLSVIVNRKVTLTTNAGTRTLFSDSSSPVKPIAGEGPQTGEFPSASPGATGPSPVVPYETNTAGSIFRVLIVLGAVAAFLYFFFHHR